MATPEPINSIFQKGRIDAEDALDLRRLVYTGDGAISADEAEWLFRLNDRCDGECDAWPDLFVEALTDYIVNQTFPERHISEENARWLIDRISQSGIVKSRTELELLVKVLEVAQSSPESLERFALDQVRRGALFGTGPTRVGVDLEPGRIGEGEVDLLRRILYAYGGGRAIAISRSEAEALFDIADATVDEDNHPSWADLFVKAIANYLMALSGYRVPTREEALKREAWLADTEVNVSGFFRRAFSGGLSGVLDAYKPREPETKVRFDEMQSEIAANEHITAEEADWLIERIQGDGIMHENERALLRFIRDESPQIDPSLKKLIDKVA